MSKLSDITIILTALSFLTHIQTIQGENILFYTGVASSYSHRVGLEPLAIKLADKGHNISIFTSLRSKSNLTHPNITEFSIQEIDEVHQDMQTKYGVLGLKSRLQSKFNVALLRGTTLFDKGIQNARVTLQNKEFLEWMQNSRFDCIVLDRSSFAELAFALAYKFNIRKVIGYVAIGTISFLSFDLYNVPPETSWAPTLLSTYESQELSFWDRLQSELLVLRGYYGYTQYYLHKVDAIAREELKLEDMPPIEDLIRSHEALVLMNGHYSDTFARSLPPNIIPVGGMHLQKSNGTLPVDLKNFLADSSFVYVSFGSAITISTLPPKFIDIFFDAFKSLPTLKFFWKWEGEFPKNVPENVLLGKWFPQHDVLSHPKIKGFVTQGGQVSIQQAIFNAVPLIILPVNGDQDYNAKRIRSVGNGIELEFFDLTADKLRDAINKLLNDKRYSRVASQLSNASRERPMHPLDLAVWWTEFILSQEDVSYLKPNGNTTWWIRRSLDIYATIFAILFISAVLVLMAVFYCGRKIFVRLLGVKCQEFKAENIKIKKS